MFYEHNDSTQITANVGNFIIHYIYRTWTCTSEAMKTLRGLGRSAMETG